MKDLKKIAEALKKEPQTPQLYVGKVISVQNQIAIVDISGIEYEVNINVAGGGDNKVILKPSLESDVLVADLTCEKRYFVLVKCEQLQEAWIKIGTSEFKINSDGIVVKKGSENLKNVISDLISEVKGIVVLPGYGTSPSVPNLTSIDNRLKSVLK